MIQTAYGQAQKVLAASIPDDVNKIFNSSCTPCHWDGGKMMALGMVNFSNWTKYEASKGASKASMICSVLTKGKMPPKKIRKEIPEIVPTKEQLDLICKWAESLRAEKKNP
jgi:cytochrome c5